MSSLSLSLAITFRTTAVAARWKKSAGEKKMQQQQQQRQHRSNSKSPRISTTAAFLRLLSRRGINHNKALSPPFLVELMTTNDEDADELLWLRCCLSRVWFCFVFFLVPSRVKLRERVSSPYRAIYYAPAAMNRAARPLMALSHFAGSPGELSLRSGSRGLEPVGSADEE